MGEFDDFAKKLADEHAVRSQEHEAKTTRDREARQARYEAAQRALEEQVSPLLEEADRACRSLGWRTESDANWKQQALGASPRVEFQVFGPKKRQLDEGTTEAFGHKILISHDGQNFDVRVSSKALWVERNNKFESKGLDGVKDAIRVAMQSLADAISPETR